MSHPTEDDEAALLAALGEHGDEPLPGEASDADIVAGALAGLRAPTFLVDSAAADEPASTPAVSRGAIVTLVAVVALASAAAIVLLFGLPGSRLGRDDEGDRGSLAPAISHDDPSVREASAREPDPQPEPRRRAPAVEPTPPPVEEEPAAEDTGEAASRTAVALPRTADGLLSHAQGLLREGKTTAAMRTYARLVERFPESREAKAALVSMGRIALERGQAKAALDHFDAYLAASAGSLVEEARYGRIRALRKLGRTAQELGSIEAFLADHGDSIYAPRLRKRAEELRSE